MEITMKVKISLDTMSSVSQFVSITSAIEHPVYLTSGHFRVSAKSLLGALCSMEWDDIWCECEEDIYTKIAQFVVY